MRLIDADAFKQENERLLHCDFPYLSEVTLEELIDNAPTIEERKKGKWREIQRYSPTDKAAINECSLCHDTVWMYDGERRWNYCPSCGAEMEYKNEKVK